jgi:hypothetical protein
VRGERTRTRRELVGEDRGRGWMKGREGKKKGRVEGLVRWWSSDSPLQSFYVVDPRRL